MNRGDTSPGGVVIAGGGTGGHLMPALAVARELERAEAGRIVFVGTERGLETRLVPGAGYDLRLIQIGGLKGTGWRRQTRSLLTLPLAVRQSLRILAATRPAVVLGIGGYASGPVLVAAGLRRIPVVVLEVNAKTGLANRLAAPWVRMAAVNFPETARDFRHAVVTGIPVREEFFLRPERVACARPRVLAFGGSQGAHALNQLVVAMMRAGEGHFDLVHQTGVADYAAMRAAHPPRVEVTAFIDDMAAAMAAADLVICRSGASTLGELAAAGRSAVLVPFPGAADQHQLRNAQSYAAAGAALVAEQAGLNGPALGRIVEELLALPERRAAMEEAVRRFAHPDAARAIAHLVLAARRG